MSAEFTANSDQLVAVAGFLNALNLATGEHDGTRIDGTFSIELPDGGCSIDARWDDEACQYVLSDRVTGGAE